MSVCYFVDYRQGSADPGPFIDYYLTSHAPLLRPLPGLRRLEIFTPTEAHDPMLEDEDGPMLITQMTFDRLADLEAAVVSDARMTARKDVGNFPPFDGTARYQATTREPYKVAEPDDDASVIYHVQYHQPAPDETAFVEYYRENHPPILAEFPGVRKVAIYVPVDWNDAPFVTKNDLMLINEVAFDSEDAMTASFVSDVRKRARADYHTFPPFDGPVTHTPMTRHVIVR